MPDTPEQAARRQIDALLTASGWTVQTKDSVNLAAAEIAEDLEAALSQFATIAEDLKR